MHQATATEGQGAVDTRQVGFSAEATFTGSFFFAKLEKNLKASTTLTWMNKWNTQSSQEVNQQASLSVTGPASSDNYTGPVEFDVFQDNVYGTFMFGFIPPPTFSLSVTPNAQNVIPGACAVYSVSTAALVSGFNNTVGLAINGLPAGISATFSPTSINGVGSSNLNVCVASSAAAGTYPAFTINGTSGIEVHSTTITLTVTGPPDFSLSATPNSQTVTAGANASYGVSIQSLNGFGNTVTLSVSGLPAGVSASFNPASISGGSGSSTLSLSTISTTPAGTYSITITGTSGATTHSTTIQLTISSGGGGGGGGGGNGGGGGGCPLCKPV